MKLRKNKESTDMPLKNSSTFSTHVLCQHSSLIMSFYYSEELQLVCVLYIFAHKARFRFHGNEAFSSKKLKQQQGLCPPCSWILRTSVVRDLSPLPSWGSVFLTCKMRDLICILFTITSTMPDIQQMFNKCLLNK